METRVNASCKSHAELDESTEINAGDKIDLAKPANTFATSIAKSKNTGRLLRDGCITHPCD